MRHLLALLLLMATVATATAQKRIEWQSENQLAWSNFKARPNKLSSYHALTNSGISFSTTYENGAMSIIVTSYFDPSGSWVKPDKKTDELLKHEHVHFDITELYARKLRKAMAEHKWTEANLERDIKRLFDKYLKLQDEAQNRYDEETDHSNNEEAQARWNERISNELKELEAYSESSIQLSL